MVLLFIDEPKVRNLVLDFPNYVDTICDFILHSTPKITVGVFGEWGTGKSTLLQSVQQILEKKYLCTCALFDAWKYENETAQIAIPLILTIIATLYKKNKDRIDELEDGETRDIREKLNRVFSGLSLDMKVGIPGIADIGLGYDFSKIYENNAVIGFPNLRSKILKLSLEQTKIHEGIDLIEELIGNNAVKGVSNNLELKLIVFVDDLDRCTPGKAAEIFEAIKVFLNIQGIVCVLGLSNKIVERAIEIKYSQLLTNNGSKEENYFTGQDYLKKIIQLPINIPIWKPDDIREYMRSLLEDYNDKEFKNTFTSNMDLISEGVESNPREIIRFLNMFVLTYQILSGDQIIDKTKLLAVQAIRLRWDWFYNAIFSDNSFLTELHKILKKEKSEKDNSSANPMVHNSLQEKPLVDFLTGKGSLIFEIAADEWPHYRRAGRIDVKKGSSKTIEDEQNYSSLISTFTKLAKDKSKSQSDEVEQLWKDILNAARMNDDFAYNLGYSIGPDFGSLDKDLQEKVWSLAEQNTHFAGGLGSALGREFGFLDKDLQEKVWSVAERNDAFTGQFSYSLGREFRTSKPEIRKRMFEMVQRNNTFAAELGAALGRDFKSVYDEAEEEVFQLTKTNNTFAGKLGYSIGENFASLDKHLQKRVWNLAEQNDAFAAKFGFFLGKDFAYLDKESQREALEMAERNQSFGIELSRSLGRRFAALEPHMRRKVFEIARNNQNDKFAAALAESLGTNISALGREARKDVWRLAKENSKFAERLGSSLARNISTLDEESQQEVSEISEKNESFRRGLNSSSDENV